MMTASLRRSLKEERESFMKRERVQREDIEDGSSKILSCTGVG
jgi:hypothetical protein